MAPTSQEHAASVKRYYDDCIARGEKAVALHVDDVHLLDTYYPEWRKKVPEKVTGIDATLEQRGNKYGEFVDHARITQNIQAAMRDSRNSASLPADMKEALEMTAHKIGRILNGDPTFHDSWHDIIGYIRLVEKTLTPEQHKPL